MTPTDTASDRMRILLDGDMHIPSAKGAFGQIDQQFETLCGIVAPAELRSGYHGATGTACRACWHARYSR